MSNSSESGVPLKVLALCVGISFALGYVVAQQGDAGHEVAAVSCPAHEIVPAAAPVQSAVCDADSVPGWVLAKPPTVATDMSVPWSRLSPGQKVERAEHIKSEVQKGKDQISHRVTAITMANAFYETEIKRYLSNTALGSQPGEFPPPAYSVDQQRHLHLALQQAWQKPPAVNPGAIAILKIDFAGGKVADASVVGGNNQADLNESMVEAARAMKVPEGLFSGADIKSGRAFSYVLPVSVVFMEMAAQGGSYAPPTAEALPLPFVPWTEMNPEARVAWAAEQMKVAQATKLHHEASYAALLERAEVVNAQASKKVALDPLGQGELSDTAAYEDQASLWTYKYLPLVIASRWSPPTGLKHGLFAEIEFKVSRDGEPFDIKLAKPSDDPVFDRSVMLAASGQTIIPGAAMMTDKEFERASNIRLRFSPEGLHALKAKNQKACQSNPVETSGLRIGC